MALQERAWLAKQQATVSHCQSVISQSKSEAMDARAAADSSSQALQAATAALSEANLSLATMAKDRQSLVGKVSELNAIVAEAQNAAAAHQVAAAAAERTSSAVLRNGEQRVAALELELSAVRITLQQAIAKATAAEAVVTRAELQRSDAQAALAAALEAADAKEADHQMTVQRLTAAADAAQQRVTELEGQGMGAPLPEALAVYQAELAHVNRLYAEATSKLSSTSAYVSSLQQTAETLAASHRVATSERDATKQLFDALVAKCAAEKEGAVESNTSHAKAAATICDLAAARDAAEERAFQLRGELAEQKAVAMAAAARVAELEAIDSSAAAAHGETLPLLAPRQAEKDGAAESDASHAKAAATICDYQGAPQQEDTTKEEKEDATCATVGATRQHVTKTEVAAASSASSSGAANAFSAALLAQPLRRITRDDERPRTFIPEA